MENLLEKYKSNFPEIDSLFDYQEEVLKLLAAKKNTLSIIPTGGGKSLIFQLAALELEGITLVISPLLALMDEQVNELNDLRNIKALALNSNLSFVEQRQLLRNLKNESFKLVYVSPERLQNPFFRAGLIASGIPVSLIVVDEAHCISQWGSSFRPDYGQINSFVEFLKSEKQNPFLFCLTATLSKKARKDILEEFQISGEQVFIASNMIRDNLKLHFQKVEHEDEKEHFLRDFLKTHKPQKSIAYLYSKRECENYSERLSDSYSTDYFHAGRDSTEKQSVYQSYLKSEIQILFATTAFGMGINIPDIECVVHLHIPNSIEEYYQQAGRGWRKKTELKDCQCLALWSNVNFDRRRQDLENHKYDIDLLKKAFKVLIGGAKIKRIGQVVNKDKDAMLNSEYNLQLLKYKLEKHGVLKTIGEVNGTPLSIKLTTDTEFWSKIKQSAKDGMDSFSFVSRMLDVPILDIIHHLYDQDLEGNIEKLPAMKKDIFFELLTVELSDSISEKIVEEINNELDFRIMQLNELQELFLSNNHEEKLYAVLK
jgi:ATP-dependent DNA helicase RecQ